MLATSFKDLLRGESLINIKILHCSCLDHLIHGALLVFRDYQRRKSASDCISAALRLLWKMSSTIATCALLQVVVPNTSRFRKQTPFSSAPLRPFTSPAHRSQQQRQLCPAPPAASPIDQQEIENINRNYCDDFICTSSPAVEKTVRSLANDIIRANGVWTRSLFSNTVAEYKGFRSFKGRDGYKTLDFIPKYVEAPVVTVTKLKMLDGGTAELSWRLQGNIKGVSVDVDMTTVVTMNLLTGQIEKHVDTWDLRRCSPPAAAAFNLAKIAFAVSKGSAAAADATNSILDSLTSMDEDNGGPIEPSANDPMKFFQQKDSFKDDAIFFIGAVTLLYVMTQAWGALFKL